ncbi:capsular biosynthesis protein [Listeria grandensis]|uniref:Capsular biosynthesis protein n=1 Tax=Listeria grandensis TaxID=1494963 RepID=A0A7X1CRA2_9LIST|nr:capsular biosynthesis protein [Listeria grandensis]
MNTRIDLNKILVSIKNNKWWLIGILLITLTSAFIYLHYFATPIYQKKTQILVNQSENIQKNNLEAQTVQADLQLVNTYSAIILSPRILTEVEKGLQNKYDIQELTDMIQVKNSTNSQVIDISVDNSSPEMAAKIANLTAQTFKKEIAKIMKIENVTTLSDAMYTGKEVPIKPQKFLIMSLSFLCGVMIGFIFILTKLFFERTFTSAEEIQELLHLNVLGEVSEFSVNYNVQTRNEK